MAEHAHTITTLSPKRADPPAAISRRMLALDGTALAGAGLIAAASAHADTELVALAASIVAGHTELDAISDRWADVAWAEIPGEVRDREEALVRDGHRLAERLANLPAATSEGLLAKARALMVYSGYDEVALAVSGQWWSGHEELLGWSLARDLLAARGAA